jgi:hypothetical protein
MNDEVIINAIGAAAQGFSVYPPVPHLVKINSSLKLQRNLLQLLVIWIRFSNCGHEIHRAVGINGT